MKEKSWQNILLRMQLYNSIHIKQASCTNRGYTFWLITSTTNVKLATRGHNQTLHEHNYNIRIIRGSKQSYKSDLALYTELSGQQQMLLEVWADRKGSIELGTRSTKTGRKKASLGFRAIFFFLKLYIVQPVTNLETSLINTMKIAFQGPN